MSTNLHPQKTNNAFLQSENHVNHYHHLHNVTFPHRQLDCWVDVFHCETNIVVAVYMGDVVQTVSLFFAKSVAGSLREALPALSQSFYRTRDRTVSYCHVFHLLLISICLFFAKTVVASLSVAVPHISSILIC